MEIVQISKDDLIQLVEDQLCLNALYEGGVDNWEWYDEALNEVSSEDIDRVANSYIITDGDSEATK